MAEMRVLRRPWERITWKENQQQKLYRDWGIAYTKKQQFEIATYCYDMALEIKEDDVIALYNRSLYYNDIAEAENALNDAQKACDINDTNFAANIRVCDALYDANLFETCDSELNARKRKFIGQRQKPFQERIDVVEQNCIDGLGGFAGIFLNENCKYFPKVLEKWHTVKDTRPLWKIQKEQNKCDVLSVLEEEIHDLHPLEIARKNLNFKIFNQIYFRKAWADVVFIRDLIKNNKSLLLSQTKKSSPFMEILLKESYTSLIKFLKMLHARNPRYTQRYKMCLNQKIANEQRETHLYRIQYKTRREMFNILKSLKKFRETGDLNATIKFVVNMMGDFLAIKTTRIMPRKFEFINEVYNTVVLMYIDKLKIPFNIDNDNVTDAEKLFKLMDIPVENEDDPTSFPQQKSIFDKKLQSKQNRVYHMYKNLINRLKTNLKFAKYPIEKCFLYHELSRKYSELKKFDESLNYAKNLIEESEICQNFAWMFIGTFQIARTHILQKDQSQISESLQAALQIANKLNSEKLIRFIDECIKISSIVFKKRMLSKTKYL